MMIKIQQTARGFTLIESMIIVALLAILIGISLPGLQNLYISSSLDSAREDIINALNKAKQLSYGYKKKVRVVFTANQNRFTLTPTGAASQTINLSPNVNISTTRTYTFNPLGLVDNIGTTITATSTLDATKSRTVTVATQFAQIKVN